MLSTYHRGRLYGECMVPNSASCKYVNLYMGMCQQRLQAGLDFHEMVRPHVKPHIDNHVLADSTVFIRGGAKAHTA